MKPRPPRSPHAHDPYRTLGKWYLGGMWLRDFTDPQSGPFMGDASELVKQLRRYHRRHNILSIIRRVDDSHVIMHYLESGNTHHYRRS